VIDLHVFWIIGLDSEVDHASRAACPSAGDKRMCKQGEDPALPLRQRASSFSTETRQALVDYSGVPPTRVVYGGSAQAIASAKLGRPSVSESRQRLAWVQRRWKSGTPPPPLTAKKRTRSRK